MDKLTQDRLENMLKQLEDMGDNIEEIAYNNADIAYELSDIGDILVNARVELRKLLNK